MSKRKRTIIHILLTFPVYFIITMFIVWAGNINGVSGNVIGQSDTYLVLGLACIAGLIHSLVFYGIRHFLPKSSILSNGIILSLSITAIFFFVFMIMVRGLPYYQGPAVRTEQIIGMLVTVWLPSLIFGIVHYYYVAVDER